MDMEILGDRLSEVESKVNTHEAVCAERYKGIIDQHAGFKDDLAELKKILMKIGYGVLAGMATLLAHQVFFK
jgi:hypothetical protein